MVWLPDGEDSLTEFTNVTDGRTDGRTPHDGTGRANTASRGKNGKVWKRCDLPSALQ